jgi:hypothetical protein
VLISATFSCKDDNDDKKPAVIKIQSVSPESGVYGDAITISGENFKATGNVVKFNNVTATIVSQDGQTIVVLVPEDATTGKISVETSQASGTSSTDFTVLTPSITGLSTWIGSAGLSILIEGQNFGSAPEFNSVQFNGAEATILDAQSNTLEVLVPDNATTGSVEVQVGSQSATTTEPFTICNDSELIISNLTFTSINANDFSFTFDVTNVGLQAVDLSKIVLQAYVSADATYGNGDEAAGGTILMSQGDTMLGQGETHTGSWTSNKSAATYPYLVADFYSSSEEINECNTSDNRLIRKIE